MLDTLILFQDFLFFLFLFFFAYYAFCRIYNIINLKKTWNKNIVKNILSIDNKLFVEIRIATKSLLNAIEKIDNNFKYKIDQDKLTKIISSFAKLLVIASILQLIQIRRCSSLRILFHYRIDKQSVANYQFLDSKVMRYRLLEREQQYR